MKPLVKKKFPLISVVIPIRNEEKYIIQCLENVRKQDYPKEKMEILVIDGMSTDKSREEIDEFHKKNPDFNVLIISNPKIERFPAMNIGIKKSNGDIVMRIDARTVIPKNYIKTCLKDLEKTGADNVGGIQKPKSTTLTQKAIGIAMSHPFGVGNAQFRLGKKSGFVNSAYLGFFRKEIFKKVGLFDESSGMITEDSDINFRIRKAGGKVYLNRNNFAYYYPRDSLRGLWSLYFRYGGGRAGYFYKHKNLQLRQTIPLLFLLSLGVSIIFSFFFDFFIFVLIAILIPYILADLFFSITCSIKHSSIKIFFKLLIIFPLMHFSWAFGFFKRLLQGPKKTDYWKN